MFQIVLNFERLKKKLQNWLTFLLSRQKQLQIIKLRSKMSNLKRKSKTFSFINFQF